MGEPPPFLCVLGVCQLVLPVDTKILSFYIVQNQACNLNTEKKRNYIIIEQKNINLGNFLFILICMFSDMICVTCKHPSPNRLNTIASCDLQQRGVLAIGLVSGPMSQSMLTLADDRIIVSGKKNHSKECNKIKKKFHRKVKKNVLRLLVSFLFVANQKKNQHTASKSTVSLSPRMAVPNQKMKSEQET